MSHWAAEDWEMKNLGRALQAARQASGLSQSRLAQRAHLNHSTISRIESGNRGATRNVLLQLSRAMALSPDARDRLLLAANFRPVDDLAVIADEPVVRELVTWLRSPEVPAEKKTQVRECIQTILTLLSEDSRDREYPLD